MAVTNRLNDEEVQKLLETLKEKESQVTQYEKEVKKLSKAKNEMIKIVQETDENLASKLLEKMPEIERIVTEENKKDRANSAKRAGKALLQMKEDSKTVNEHMKVDCNHLSMGKVLGGIALTIGRNITGTVEEKNFSDFQKEIFSYYANHDEKFNLEELDREMAYKEIETAPEDLLKVDWQYCIVFSNPDLVGSQDKWESEEAYKMYDRCFWPDKRMKNSTSKTQENMIYKHILNKTCKIEGKKGEVYYAYNKGGNFSNQDGKSIQNKDVKDPKDILTLLRNISMFKLTKVLHLQTAALFSEDGEKIYMLIHADEELLRDHADWIEYELQFEIGSTDVLSLEPCDDKLRPYRLMNEDKPGDIVKLELELKNFSDVIFQNELDVYNGQNIVDHTKHTPEEWEAYKCFLEFMIQKKSETQKLILQYPDLKGLFIRELYQKAFLYVRNEKNHKMFKNLWNYFGVPPIGAYKKYYREIDKILDKDRAEGFWRRYVNTEGKVSLFKDLDRIKLLISYIFSQLRLDKMLASGVIENYFPLHSKDYNDLKRFNTKTDSMIPDIPLKSQEDVELKEIKNEEDNLHPETDHNLTSKLLEKQSSYSHVKEKWNYSWIGKVPSNSIRNYFGEKVAFYYEFLSFYTMYLFILGIFGIITYIIQNQDGLESKSIEFFHDLGFTKSRLVIAFNTLYSFIVIIWSSVFLEHWKRREARLATEWGQKETQAADQILPSYKGKKRRSPVNDNMNETTSSIVSHLLKKLIAYLISIVIVVGVIVIVIYLLYFRNWLVVNKVWGSGNRIIVNIPSK
jgi:hypothetical protein